MDDQSQLCRLFTEEAVDFIRRNREEPFFLYLPHAYVHHPRGAREEFLRETRNDGDPASIDWTEVEANPGGANMPWRTRAQIAELDWSVGEILRTIEELSLGERTLVLFTSDNGGARGCVNLPLRGGKGSTWEGGMREPTVVWWPGRIAPGSASAEILSVMDLLPTFAGLSGAEVPADRVLDGYDISSILLGEPEAISPREALFYYDENRLEAARSGPWKLFHTTGALYNLSEDIGETTDVAAQHPEVVARLKAHLNRAIQELGEDETSCPECRIAGRVDNPRPLIPHSSSAVAAP
jgi:arylsulfatase A-like enzyme